MELTAIVCCRTRLYAEGIQRLLEDDDDLKLIGVASDNDQIKNLLKYDPDVIISDIGSCREILNFLPSGVDKKVLLVNDAEKLSNENLKDMIADGLGGILPKDADGKLLQKATHKLHAGELWIDHQTMREVLSRREEVKPEIQLTKKEKEILGHICSGMTNKEIARKLFISEQTVKSHCNHLFKKFGVKSRLKLALSAPQCRYEGQPGSKFIQ